VLWRIATGTVASRPTQPVGSRMDRPSAGMPIVAVTPEDAALGSSDGAGGNEAPDGTGPVGADETPADGTPDDDAVPDGPTDADIRGDAPDVAAGEAGAPDPSADAADPIEEAGVWVVEPPHAVRAAESAISATDAARTAAGGRCMGEAELRHSRRRRGGCSARRRQWGVGQVYRSVQFGPFGCFGSGLDRRTRPGQPGSVLEPQHLNIHRVPRK
jgi:hypothetical protein